MIFNLKFVSLTKINLAIAEGLAVFTWPPEVSNSSFLDLIGSYTPSELYT